MRLSSSLLRWYLARQDKKDKSRAPITAVSTRLPKYCGSFTDKSRT